MNTMRVPYDCRIVKQNGTLLPLVRKTLENWSDIPYFQTSLPWAEKERRHFSYSADNLNHVFQADKIERNRRVDPLRFYENKFYETLVGSLLRKFLLKNNPGLGFYYASRRDDYAWYDYIVTKWKDIVGMDLTTTTWRIGSFETNYTPVTLRKKIDRFHNETRLPEEFLDSKTTVSPDKISLIIIQVNHAVLSAFAHDFFTSMLSEKREIDILAYFSEWIRSSSSDNYDEITCIVGMSKTLTNLALFGDETLHIVTQIGSLFAGIENIPQERVQ